MADSDCIEAGAVARDCAVAHGSRRRVLTTFLLTELVLLMWFVGRDAFLVAGIKASLSRASAESRADSRDLFCRDPAPGSPLPAGAVGHAIRKRAKPSSVGFLLVPIGDCAG